MRASYFSTSDPRRAVSFLAKFRSPVSYLAAASCILAGLAICTLQPVTGWAQGTDTALLRGTVKDPTGAVIPDAAVTATAIATQVQTRAQTDRSEERRVGKECRSRW